MRRPESMFAQARESEGPDIAVGAFRIHTGIATLVSYQTADVFVVASALGKCLCLQCLVPLNGN